MGDTCRQHGRRPASAHDDAPNLATGMSIAPRLACFEARGGRYASSACTERVGPGLVLCSVLWPHLLCSF